MHFVEHLLTDYSLYLEFIQFRTYVVKLPYNMNFHKDIPTFECNIEVTVCFNSS